MLKIALSKGRIFEDTLPLLEKVGIVPLEHPETSRKLILDTNQEDIKLVIIRATDVPTYVEYGATDMGIAGKDVLLEHGGKDLYEPVDLKIAQCRLMEAVPVNPRPIRNRLRIATKYVNCTQNYYANQGIQVEIIKLYGSMELAPLPDIDLADRIVDLVSTGKTLEANGLKPLEPPILHISARLIVNKAAMKLKHAQIKSLIKKLQIAVNESQ